MFHKQKETLLALLKSDKANRNYKNNYWFSYKDYLNLTDDFTRFACENLSFTTLQNLFDIFYTISYDTIRDGAIRHRKYCSHTVCD